MVFVNVLLDAGDHGIDILAVDGIGDHERIRRIRIWRIQAKLKARTALANKCQPVANERLACCRCVISLPNECIHVGNDLLARFNRRAERQLQLGRKHRVLRGSDELLPHHSEPDDGERE